MSGILAQKAAILNMHTLAIHLRFCIGKLRLKRCALGVILFFFFLYMKMAGKEERAVRSYSRTYRIFRQLLLGHVTPWGAQQGMLN